MRPNMSEEGSRPGQDTSVEYEIIDGHCIPGRGNRMAEVNLGEGGQTN